MLPPKFATILVVLMVSSSALANVPYRSFSNDRSLSNDELLALIISVAYLVFCLVVFLSPCIIICCIVYYLKRRNEEDLRIGALYAGGCFSTQYAYPYPQVQARTQTYG